MGGTWVLEEGLRDDVQHRPGCPVLLVRFTSPASRISMSWLLFLAMAGAGLDGRILWFDGVGVQ